MKITHTLLDSLTEQAKVSPRLRMNHDLRDSDKDTSQRMLNAIEPGSLLPIHRHQKTSETVVCLRGCIVEEFYDDLIKVTTVPKKQTLTDAALETLSIVAYKQPVTRLDVEKIRGVNSDSSLNKLLEYGLITEVGRLDAPGKPILFGTTEQFLRSFGVKSIEDLPQVNPDVLEDFKVQAEKEIQIKLDI